jgi:GxxExxY protein
MERITDSEAVMAEIIYPELGYAVQGAFYDVYNALRHLDLSEHGWESALEIALVERGIVVERQVEFELRYKGYRIGRFFVDVVADGKLVIELKVEEALLPHALSPRRADRIAPARHRLRGKERDYDPVSRAAY